MRRPLAAAAAVLVALALWPSFGTFDPWALALVTAGAIAAVAAALRAGSEDDRAAWTERATAAILGTGAALGLASTLLVIEGDRRAPPQHPYVISLAAVALAMVVSYALPRPPRWLVKARFPLLLASFLGIAAAALLHDRLPLVDVWMFRQLGAEALAHGKNPYELVFPNIYRHDRFYGPGVLQDGKVLVYPYPPLMIAADLPARLLLGDVRWTNVAAALAAAVLLARTGRGRAGELAAALVLFQPRTLRLLEVAWSEPLVLLGFAVALAALARWRARAPDGWIAAALGLAALVAAKQYAPLLAAPLLLAAPPGRRARAALLSAAVVIATFLPFAIWNPFELWRDVAWAQLAQPFRIDALSWLVAWARWTGTTPSAAIGFAAGAAVLAAGLWRRPELPRAATIAGAAFIALVLFNKQAFLNYYWLASGLLGSAAALGSVDRAALAPGDETAPRDAAA